MYLLSIWVPSDIILCILETSILRIVFTWEGWEHGSMVVLVGGTRLLHFLLHLVAESTVRVETCNSILCCVFWHFAKCVICHAQLHSSAWIFIVPAVGISAVQKQQEKLQNGAQLPGCDIAQNSDLGGAKSGTCGIKAIITQRKLQGLGGLLGDPPKDVVQTDASAVWHKTSW
jgi:hypothetical protein